MKTGLNKREKYLVFFAFALAIGYIAYTFALKPAYIAYNEAKVTYQKVSEEKAKIEENLANEKIFKETFRTVEASYNKSKDRYPDVATNESIDKMITGLCIKHSIQPVLLGLSVREVKAPEPVIDKEDADAVKEAEAKALEKDLLKGEASEPLPPPKEDVSVFVISKATLKGIGNYENLKNLVNEVNAEEFIRITSLKFADNLNSILGQNTTLPTIEIEFEITMEDESVVK